MITGTLRRGDTNNDVGALQQLLLEAGMPATGEGDSFGPRTEATVLDFQHKSNLAADGIVGPKTLAALNGADSDTRSPEIPAPDYASMTALMAAAVMLADGAWRRGVKETRDRNRGPEVDVILAGVYHDGDAMLCYSSYVNDYSVVPECGWCKPNGHKTPLLDCFGSPWCARAALYWIQSAAAGFSTADPTRAPGAGDLAGAAKWIRWARKMGYLVEGAPRAGDVMCISTPGHGHVMLAASVVGDRVCTREGNSSNRVNAHWRDVASITAWIRLP